MWRDSVQTFSDRADRLSAPRHEDSPPPRIKSDGFTASVCSEVFLCPLTQKSLLLENVLIHKSKQRKSCSVVVVVVVGGHAVSSFALQQNTDTDTLFNAWRLCFHINIFIFCLTSTSPGHTLIILLLHCMLEADIVLLTPLHLCYNNNNNNNVFIIRKQLKLFNNDRIK